MRVAGFGFRAGADMAALADALARAEAACGGAPVDALAAPGAKARALALRDLAEARGVPVYAVEVAGVATPTQSPRLLARFGTGSVAEAAALVCAGAGARLIVPRIMSADGRAVAAIATGYLSKQETRNSEQS